MYDKPFCCLHKAGKKVTILGVKQIVVTTIGNVPGKNQIPLVSKGLAKQALATEDFKEDLGSLEGGADLGMPYVLSPKALQS